MKILTSTIRRSTSARGRKIRAIVLALLVTLATSPLKTFAKDGDIDASFGGGGMVTTDFQGGYDLATSIRVLQDGNLLVAGTTYGLIDAIPNISLARYKPDGTLDTKFGDDGKVTVNFTGQYETVNALAVQKDGKIVVAGREWVNQQDDNFLVARFNADGSPDESFGDGGRVITEVMGPIDRAESLAIQNDGKILVGGSIFNGKDSDVAVVRYDANGELDTTFGNKGKAITNLGYDETSFEMCLRKDGRILLAGFTTFNQGDTLLVCYTSNGFLDFNFGFSGKVTTDLSSSQEDGAVAVIEQPDGRILIGGYAETAAGADQFLVARYSTSGTLDGSFGDGGKTVLPLLGHSDQLGALMLQDDGKILAAGTSSNGDYNSSAVARFDTSGNLDPTFGDNGKVIKDLYGRDCSIEALAIQSDGDILAAGNSQPKEYNFDFTLLRYEAYSSSVPVIFNAYLSGKTLVVEGANFKSGAFVFINGDKYKKTFNSPDAPATTLTVKKAAVWIPPGRAVQVQVRNPDGTMSDGFSYTRPAQ